MVSPQAASAVTVVVCASSAAEMASVNRSAVRGERLAMRVRMWARPAERSAVGVPQRARASRAPPLVASLSPRARSSRGRHRQQGVSEPVGGPGGVRGEVGVSAVEYPQPHQQLVAGGRPGEPVGVAPGVVGEHRGVFGVGLGRPGVKVRGAPHREARHIGHRNLSASGRLQQQRRRRAGRVDHQSDRAVHSRVVDQAPDQRLVVAHAARQHLGAGRCHNAGVVVAFGDVDADEHLDVDAVGFLHGRTPWVRGHSCLRCSRRLRLNHFTSSPKGMSLSEVPDTRPRRATTPPRAINVTGGYSPTRRGEQPAPTLPRQSRSTR